MSPKQEYTCDSFYFLRDSFVFGLSSVILYGTSVTTVSPTHVATPQIGENRLASFGLCVCLFDKSKLGNRMNALIVTVMRAR